jgi:hypothetical protein
MNLNLEHRDGGLLGWFRDRLAVAKAYPGRYWSGVKTGQRKPVQVAVSLVVVGAAFKYAINSGELWAYGATALASYYVGRFEGWHCTCDGECATVGEEYAAWRPERLPFEQAATERLAKVADAIETGGVPIDLDTLAGDLRAVLALVDDATVKPAK